MVIATILAAAVAVVALVLVVFVAATWAPDRPLSELKARWAQPPSSFVQVQGMSVHLRDEGPRDDPVPVVLLHGTSSSLHTWEGWAQALRAGRRVIRFDLPGIGLTGPPPDADYRIERYVHFVAAMLDELGVSRCALAGNSFGGQVAWETALAHPERVEKLILVDAAGYPFQPESLPLGFLIARIPLLNRLMEFTLPRRVIESSLRNVYADPGKVTPELVDRYFELTLREGNRRALARRFAQAPAGIHPERIAALKVPTLILWGQRDRLIPPGDAERFHRDIAGSRLIAFDRLGHVPQEEDPLATVAAVKAFIF
ncbi:MAG TPA: alpha/beta hydrolase [Burkholderiales bacterium]|nr:alpha/beta hydrolase [Burkholderiales bacterium]